MAPNTFSPKRNDLFDLITKYLQHWKLFIVSGIICVAIAFAYIKLSEKVYQVNANILIKSEKGKSAGSGLGGIMQSMGTGFSFGNNDVDNELLVVKSHTILRNAIKELGINTSYTSFRYGIKKKTEYEKSPLKLSTSPTLADTLSVGLLFKVDADGDQAKVKVYAKNKKIKTLSGKLPLVINIPYGSFVLSSTPNYRPKDGVTMEISFNSYDGMAEEVSKTIDISVVSKKAMGIGLSYKDVSPTRGKDLLNKIIELYNADGINDKNLVAENTAQFLEERLAIISSELTSAENEIEQYKIKNKLTDIEKDASIAVAQNLQYEQGLLGIQTELATLALTEEILNDPTKKYQLVPNVSNSAGSALGSYNQLLLERAKLLNLAGSSKNNPQIILLEQQIDAVLEITKKTIENAKKGINISMKQMQSEEGKYKLRIKNAPLREREFIEIKRQQMIKEELFIFLLERNEENAITLAITTPSSKIIDAAYTKSKPVAPKSMIILLVALVLAGILPIAYIYLKEELRIRFSNRKELEQLTQSSIVGEICQNKTGNHIVVEENNTSPINELFRLLRNNLQFLLTGSNHKVVLITSTESGEGKTFISCNTAISLALTGKRVALIGLDIRKPRLAEYLSLPEGKQGITSYISTPDMKPEDIPVHKLSYKTLDIIMAGPIPPNPSELIANVRLDELFIYLRNKYDYIIIDSAPVGMVSDSFALNRLSDTTLYVCRADYTQRRNIEFFNKINAEKKLINPALVLNDVKNSDKTGYGYGYGHNSK